MVYPIENFERIWVRGSFVDLAKAAREETNYGLTGPVQFVPMAKTTLNYASEQIISMKPYVVFPDPVDGYFEIQLPSTDDPDVNPTDFKYEVTEPTGRKYFIKVPHDTPTLYDPEDHLNGLQVINLVHVAPDPENPDGTVQLLKGLTGRGVEALVFDENDHLIVQYDDGLTQDAGYMPGTHSVNGRSGDVTLSKADVGLNNVNNTSDANKPVSTATQQALDGKSDTGHTHDGRYYTETEVDNALAGKSDTGHQHAIGDVTGLTTALDDHDTALAAKPDSADIDTIDVLTQAAYDALATKDSRTLYVVVG